MKTILSTTDWAHLQKVFDAAINLEPELRADYLKDACAGSPGLRTRVDSLLAAIEEETSVGLIVGGAASNTVEASLPATGGLLGHYKISGVIGRGGMGIVYRATRADDEYQKEVAIKIATMSLLAPDLRQRFLAERQILANLDHPNIARLLDGGTTSEGIPYVVMELVDGQPIDAYCESAGLDRRQRIELMITVARSVDFAHRHLVVHRDLKPENVHVTAGGIPKLLDFGIAKALNPEASGIRAAATVDAARLMTPEYASPEQVLGQAITTATDVYQLGILLYLLLTGRRPFQELGKTIGELEKSICETPPSRPGLDPDIDRVILQALEKDPQRRYASANAFAEDLERYLGGFPVRARTSSFAYRAVKFASRHKLSVAAASLTLVLILGFSIGMALLAKRLAQQRNRAQVQLQRSERVSELLQTVFGGADPNSAQAKNATARELLDRGTAAVSEKLETEPEVQASLYSTLGHIYDNLGEIDRADDLMQRSLAIRRKQYGENSIETAKGLSDEAEMLLDKGQYARSEALSRKALALRQSLIGKTSAETAETMNFLGAALSDQGRRSEAEALFRRSVSIWETARGPKNTEMLEPLGNLAFEQVQRGDYESAATTARRALALSRTAFGEDSPQTSRALQVLGYILRSGGKYEEGETLLRQSLEIERKALGPKNMGVAEAESNLATALRDEGQFAEAESLYLDGLEIRSKLLGPESSQVASTKLELALLYKDRREPAKAEPLFRSSVAILLKVVGEASPDVANGRALLADTLVARGKLAEARELLNKALPVAIKSTGEKGLDAAYIELTLGKLQEASHQRREAETTFRQTLAIFRSTLPPNHPSTALALELLASLLLHEGRKQEAQPLLTEALGIRQKTLPHGSWKIRSTEELLTQARGNS